MSVVGVDVVISFEAFGFVDDPFVDIFFVDFVHVGGLKVVSGEVPGVFDVYWGE